MEILLLFLIPIGLFLFFKYQENKNNEEFMRRLDSSSQFIIWYNMQEYYMNTRQYDKLIELDKKYDSERI